MEEERPRGQLWPHPNQEPHLLLSPKIAGRDWGPKATCLVQYNWCSDNMLVLSYQNPINRKFKFHVFPSLPYRSNVSGSHSYPLLLKKAWHGVHKYDDSSSYASQPHFLLISSRIPAFEVQSMLGGLPFSKLGFFFFIYTRGCIAIFWPPCVWKWFLF